VSESGSGRLYTVEIEKGVLKVLNRLPRQINDRLFVALRELAHNPRPRGCVKLEGSDSDYRVRVGDYRILYTVYDERLIVLVVDVGPRKDIYRRRRR
jgi:mRNA interferase RelE/StbE